VSLLGYLKHSPYIPNDHHTIVELESITQKVTPELNVGYDVGDINPYFRELGIKL
jgi:hypothetical protein